MQQTDLEENLAYVRRVAEAGANAPYIGGKEMIAYGSMTALAFAGHWAIGAYQIVPWAYPAMWATYGIVMGAVGHFLQSQTQARPGAGALSNRVDSAVWANVVIGLVSVVAGILAHAYLTKDPSVVTWILPTSFALYGVALSTTGQFAKETALKFGGIIFFISAFGAAVLIKDPNLYLYAALAVVVGMILPGSALITNKPKSNG